MVKSIVAVMEDMPFSAKIDSTAKFNKIETAFVKSKIDLFEKTRLNSADLILIDLDFTSIGPRGIIAELKKDTLLQKVKVIGYFAQHDLDKKAEAIGAGIDHIMLKSELTEQLSVILR